MIISGTYFALSAGNGFVKGQDGGELFIYSENRRGAVHSDTVTARMTGVKNGKNTGVIVQISQRGASVVTGKYYQTGALAFIEPDNAKFGDKIQIVKNLDKNLIAHKVAVSLTSTEKMPYQGALVADLGHKDAPGADILSIVAQMNIPFEFPEDVSAQAREIPDSVLPAQYGGRRDLTKTPTVTIDGADALDLDDAVSLSKNPDETFLLTVSVADASDYVTQGSPLDAEALRRGTSIYLADRVIPMLPQKLSNGICSLNENAPRLCVSCEILLDKNADVIRSDVFESVICVDKRMSYETADKFFDGTDASYAHFAGLLCDMRELAALLSKKRMERGAIDFNFPEAKIVLDENGRTKDITVRRHGVSAQIIEEFMILANETVAARFFAQDTPFVYRCHNRPNRQKHEKFKRFCKGAGLSVKGANPKSYQNLLNRAAGLPIKDFISNVMLRCLDAAVYSPENTGHFGLASACYCHFTSPIRRYPDLLVHRIIKMCLHGQINENKEELTAALPARCVSCSKTERRAIDCERSVAELKKAEFLSEKTGAVYDGVISGITSFGAFVQLQNTCEGLCRVSSLDGFFTFDENSLSLSDARAKKTYSIGQKVKICVKAVNTKDGKCDFTMVDA